MIYLLASMLILIICSVGWHAVSIWYASEITPQVFAGVTVDRRELTHGHVGYVVISPGPLEEEDRKPETPWYEMEDEPQSWIDDLCRDIEAQTREA